MESFAIISLKGGVGKTTLTVNLGAALAEMGKRALLIDLDPQTDLTRSVGIDAFQTKGVEYLLERDLKFDEVVRSHNEFLDVLPASKKLKAMELSLSNIFVKAKDNYFCYLLKNVVEPQKHRYDFVLIDCPPSSGFLTINALAFVKNILIPVECQFLGFESTKRTISLISKVKRFSNREVKPPIVVPLMFDARNKLSYLIVERLQKAFNGALTNTKINVNVSLAEAPAFGKTIYDYKPKSRGAQDFLALAAEMIERFYPEDAPVASDEVVETELESMNEATEADSGDTQDETPPSDKVPVEDSEVKNTPTATETAENISDDDEGLPDISELKESENSVAETSVNAEGNEKNADKSPETANNVPAVEKEKSSKNSNSFDEENTEVESNKSIEAEDQQTVDDTEVHDITKNESPEKKQTEPSNKPANRKKEAVQE